MLSRIRPQDESLVKSRVVTFSCLNDTVSKILNLFNVEARRLVAVLRQKGMA